MSSTSTRNTPGKSLGESSGIRFSRRCPSCARMHKAEPYATGISQFPPEEIGRRMVTAQPGIMPQEAVDLVGQDELLEIDALLAQRIGERDGLAEVDVTIVIAVDQQHRRAPRSHARHGRRFEGGARRVGSRGS